MYFMLFHNFLSNNLFYLFSKLTLILKINFMFFYILCDQFRCFFLKNLMLSII